MTYIYTDMYINDEAVAIWWLPLVVSLEFTAIWITITQYNNISIKENRREWFEEVHFDFGCSFAVTMAFLFIPWNMNIIVAGLWKLTHSKIRNVNNFSITDFSDIVRCALCASVHRSGLTSRAMRTDRCRRWGDEIWHSTLLFYIEQVRKKNLYVYRLIHCYEKKEAVI